MSKKNTMASRWFQSVLVLSVVLEMIWLDYVFSLNTFETINSALEVQTLAQAPGGCLRGSISTHACHCDDSGLTEVILLQHVLQHFSTINGSIFLLQAFTVFKILPTRIYTSLAVKKPLRDLDLCFFGGTHVFSDQTIPSVRSWI